MPIIESTGLGTPLQSAGAPSAGTDEVQTITTTGTPAGGVFRLSYQGLSTGDIAYNAAAAAVDTALEALTNIGAGGVTCAGGPLPTGVTVTFTGALAKTAVPTLVLSYNGLTGGASPSVTIAETTPGVDATGKGAPKGALLIRLDTGVLMINTGTAAAPTWVSVGSQT